MNGSWREGRAGALQPASGATTAFIRRRGAIHINDTVRTTGSRRPSEMWNRDCSLAAGVRSSEPASRPAWPRGSEPAGKADRNRATTGRSIEVR